MDLSHFYIVPFEVFAHVGFSLVFCGVPATLAAVAFVLYKFRQQDRPKGKHYE